MHCKKKASYVSQKTAELIVERINAKTKHRHRNKKKLYVYKCDECPWWHLTSRKSPVPKPKRKKQKRAKPLPSQKLLIRRFIKRLKRLIHKKTYHQPTTKNINHENTEHP